VCSPGRVCFCTWQHCGSASGMPTSTTPISTVASSSRHLKSGLADSALFQTLYCCRISSDCQFCLRLSNGVPCLYRQRAGCRPQILSGVHTPGLSRAHLHGRIHHLQPTLYYGICRNMSSSIFWLYGMVKPLPIMLGKGAR
jgi:hypothetical protein